MVLTKKNICLGISMLISSQYVTKLLGDSSDSESHQPDVGSLAAMFFVLNFLCATHDVVVDGWALTMLKPKNVGYASICNSVGQDIGVGLGYILFTTLDGYGLITLHQFLLFSGVTFLITTTLIALFKKEGKISAISPETDVQESETQKLGVLDTYKILLKIAKHPLCPIVAVVLLSFCFGFSAAESMISIKLVESGVPKEKIAMIAVPMMPIKFAFTMFISRFTVGPRPMNVWLTCYPVRLFFCLALTLLVYVTPLLRLQDGEYP